MKEDLEKLEQDVFKKWISISVGYLATVTTFCISLLFFKYTLSDATAIFSSLTSPATILFYILAIRENQKATRAQLAQHKETLSFSKKHETIKLFYEIIITYESSHVAKDTILRVLNNLVKQEVDILYIPTITFLQKILKDQIIYIEEYHHSFWDGRNNANMAFKILIDLCNKHKDRSDRLIEIEGLVCKEIRFNAAIFPKYLCSVSFIQSEFFSINFNHIRTNTNQFSNKTWQTNHKYLGCLFVYCIIDGIYDLIETAPNHYSENDQPQTKRTIRTNITNCKIMELPYSRAKNSVVIIEGCDLTKCRIHGLVDDIYYGNIKDWSFLKFTDCFFYKNKRKEFEDVHNLTLKKESTAFELLIQQYNILEIDEREYPEFDPENGDNFLTVYADALKQVDEYVIQNSKPPEEQLEET